MPPLRLLVAAATGCIALATVQGAAACGGLVAPNGAVRLARAATLVAYHDGVESYLTSFSYQGTAANVGWIVPLPAVPDDVTKGGAWTLQRLAREAEPRLAVPQVAAGGSAATGDAVVIRTVQIDALDVSVLRGSGQAVLDWCASNGFALNDETRSHLLAYARGTPIFMAARYDLAAARLRNTFAGDGTPVLITMHTPSLWVPLEVLANADDPVDADVYLLTDSRPPIYALGGPVAPGMRLLRQEPMYPALYRDLTSDRASAYVRPDGWFTALRLQAPGSVVTYDLTVATSGTMSTAPLGAMHGGGAQTGGGGALIAAGGDGGGLALLIAGGIAAMATLALGALLVAGRCLRARRPHPTEVSPAGG